MLIKRLILFLVRWRLGLKKYEPFQFDNQKTDAVYYFSDSGIMKAVPGTITKSRVSLNWLLDDECGIISCDDT
jgi:hypothetical protein